METIGGPFLLCIGNKSAQFHIITLWLYRFDSDMGSALWEVLSKHQFPEGRE